MEYKEISWFGDIITGSTPSTSDKNNYNSNDIPFIKPDDLDKNDITYLNNNKYYVSKYCRNKLRLFPKGSVLCSCIGIIGKIGIATEESCCNQQINVIVPDKNKVYSEFLAYSLKYQAKYFSANANAPVVPLINKSDFSKIKIPYYDLDEQAKIINDINAIVNNIKLNKNLLVNFDNIVKSQFIEMFGTCNEYTNITNCVDIMDHLRKPINSEERMKMKEGILYPYYGAIGQVGYVNDYLSDFEGLCIAEDCGNYKAGEESAYIVKGKIWVNNHAHLLKCKDNYNLYFLKEFLFQADLSEYVNGATRQKLTQSKLREVKVLNPSLELQNKFADFVQQIDKSKYFGGVCYGIC